MSVLLVTGAGGVIAARVVERALAEGHRVVATDARAEGLQSLARLGADVEVMALPSADAAALVERVRPDVLVHAAAVVDVEQLQEQPVHGFRVNAVAAVDLLSAAGAAGVGRFVFLSSRAVYGLADGGVASQPPVSEDEPLRPERVYDVCKVAVEGMGRNVASATGMQFTALRFATIFGPGKTERHSNASLFSRLVELPRSGLPISVDGDPGEAYDLVYVDDVRDAVYRACMVARIPALAYNIGSGRITTLGDVISAVRQAVPAARIEVTGTGQALPLRYRYPLDISRAAIELGYRPAVSIADAVERYLVELDTRSLRT